MRRDDDPGAAGARVVMRIALQACVSQALNRVSSIRDSTVHWTARGSGQPTMVFVHGWACDETAWKYQTPLLSRSHRVITLDLPGHGKSAQPIGGEYSMDMFATAVERVRRAANVDRAVFVGHSMGAAVIRRYALSHPRHVSALVLVEGLIQSPKAGAAVTLPPMTGVEGLRARQRIVQSMYGPRSTAKVRHHIAGMMLTTPEATAARAMAATWDVSRWTDQAIVGLPVFGMYARGSRFADRSGMRHLYPTMNYEELDGVGHFVMLDRPQAFNDFMGRVAAKCRQLS